MLNLRCSIYPFRDMQYINSSMYSGYEEAKYINGEEILKCILKK